MDITKLQSIASLGQKLFALFYQPDYNGDYTYTYGKDIFTDNQIEFLRQFEGKTLDMFLATPTNFEKYDKTIVVREGEDNITIGSTFRKVLFYYLTFLLKKETEEFLELIDGVAFSRALGSYVENKKSILEIYNVPEFEKFMNIHMTNFAELRVLLKARGFWLNAGGHHEIYKYQIEETLEVDSYIYTHFPDIL